VSILAAGAQGVSWVLLAQPAQGLRKISSRVKGLQHWYATAAATAGCSCRSRVHQG
jgi:hypothetical protein